MASLPKFNRMICSFIFVLCPTFLFAEDPVQFAKDIWPILKSKCVECHGPAKHKSGLRLDSAEAIQKGGDTGAIFMQGNPAESSLFQRISASQGDPTMMPSGGKRLEDKEIEIIGRWIKEGASFGDWKQEVAGAEPKPESKPEARPEPQKEPAQTAIPSDLPTRKIEFNRDVRPVLSNNCYKCHGPDKNARKANLRLDSVEEATRDLGSGRRAITANDLTKSEVVRRIFSPDEKDKMPPADSGKHLTDDERKILAAWIQQGAEYEPHWAYIPPKRVEPPAVSGLSNPIDAFIQTKLKEVGLKPSPQADPITLARRISFDLTGLPPTPGRVDAFAKNPSDEGYSAFVEELLASPHFGERMAIDWLDQVRYADSNGYHSDEYRSIWPYRDYVINSFNRNKRYDEFTIEQLAGDLLPNATREQIVASGFNRMNQITAEGGAQAKEYRTKYNADRVRAVASVWLGATMGCAECHDHKFDPYKQRDFYGMAAFFSDLEEDDVFPGEDDWAPLLRLPNERQAGHLAALENLIKSLEEIPKTPTDELAQGQRQWESAIRSSELASFAGWSPSRPVTFTSAAGCDLKLLDDFSILSSGIIPFQETYTVTLATNLKKITGIRLEAISDPSFKKGVTRTRGQFYLNEFEVEASENGAVSHRIGIASAKDDTKGIGQDASKAIDGDMLSAWFRYPSEKDMRKTVTGIFSFAEPIAGGPGTVLTVRLRHQGGAMFDRTAFARIRLLLTTDPAPALDAKLAPPEYVLNAPAGIERPKQVDETIAAYYRTIAPELESVRSQLQEARERREKLLKEIPTTLVSKHREQPRITRILRRGNWQDESGEVVSPSVPAFLSPPRIGDRWGTRMDLAEWMVSKKNPLTARVYMNRMWKLFFGRGISKVLDDLGAQGEWPTHPELLDWLATEFMESGWDVKHMIRLMVTSQTYRQGSNADAASREADPDNKWYARQAAHRHEAEIIRDDALRVAGLLNDSIGGPSFKPYQPDGYWDHLNFPPRKYFADAGDSQYRRGLYVHWQRSFLHPSMKAFDAPTREECTAQRVVSNTPLQALALLNDPSYVEAARSFAARIVREGGANPDERIRWAFRQLLSRPPADAEQKILAEIYSKHSEQYKSDPDAAGRLLQTGLSPAPSDLDRTELAAWTSIARILLNLHETVTRS